MGATSDSRQRTAAGCPAEKRGDLLRAHCLGQLMSFAAQRIRQLPQRYRFTTSRTVSPIRIRRPRSSTAACAAHPAYLPAANGRSATGLAGALRFHRASGRLVCGAHGRRHFIHGTSHPRERSQQFADRCLRRDPVAGFHLLPTNTPRKESPPPRDSSCGNTARFGLVRERITPSV